MKTIAMYLPQFHRVKENDEWWGEGFTEWTAVKSAESLFEGHYQPRVPLNNQYYDLMQKETMQHQADLMKEFNVSGLCFYHYYFKNGRKILEKPAENLLHWKDIDMPYCFCWANESWGRTWSKLQNKNIWSEKYEQAERKDIHNDDGILLEQCYGMQEEWRKHFEYLLPFFQDSRYITKEGQPLFLIYKPDSIYCLNQMIDFWKELSEEYNIKEPYIIGLNTNKCGRGIDAILLNAPGTFALEVMVRKNGISCYNYADVWQKILQASPINGIQTYYGGFVNYDDSPRRKKNGAIVENFSIDIFQNGIHELAVKNAKAGNDFLFINAWNEWGEGMYLEPDEKYGYAYLQSVKDATRGIENIIAESTKEVKKEESSTYYKTVVYKQTILVNCFERWMTLKEKEIDLVSYLRKYHWNKIAVYGMGKLGVHFLYELEKSGVEIAYIVDRRSELKYPGIPVISPEDDFPKADILVVTAVADYDDIYENYKEKIKNPMISLEQILYECE